MQTRSLRTLVEIARHGSFAAAAAHLNMTLSAVSMQMKALEAELGAALFDRTSRPPRLTPIGRDVRDRATRLLAEEAALTALCQPTDRLTGRFRIGFVPTASVRLLPGFLIRTRDAAGEARFDIETGLSAALEDKVAAGQLDAAVVTASPEPPAGLSYRVLATEALALATPPGTEDHDPDALARHLSFLHFSPASGIGKLIAQEITRLCPSGHARIELDSVEAIMECVNHRLGFTLLPEPDIRRYAAPGVTPIRPGPTPITRAFALVLPARTPAETARRLAALFAPPP